MGGRGGGWGGGVATGGYEEMFSLQFVGLLEMPHALDRQNTWLLPSWNAVHRPLPSANRTEIDSRWELTTWRRGVHSLSILQQMLPFQTPSEVSVPK